jgi:hypothetical protein
MFYRAAKMKMPGGIQDVGFGCRCPLVNRKDPIHMLTPGE